MLQPLGLRDTWYYSHTDPPQSDLGPYADIWFSDINSAHTPVLSLDWAGGGLATTTADLQTLLRSLVAGKPDEALEAFQAEWTENAVAPGLDYGYSLWRIRPDGLFFLLRGYPNLYGASGSTGSFLYWAPEYDAVISGTFNQMEYTQNSIMFLVRVLIVLGRVET